MRMKKHLIFSRLTLGLILVFLGLVGWKQNGSLVFVALLLLGLMKFLGALLHTITGKTPLGNYRHLYILLLGALIGFVLFDVPSIYLFHIYSYYASVPEPFSNFPLYAVEALGWGAFFIIFYDSYQLVHLTLDRNFHRLGLTYNKSRAEKTFSALGVIGVLMFLTAIAITLIGFLRGTWWPAIIAAFGVWFTLEDIEFKKNHDTLLFATSRGHLIPLLSILVGSLVLGFIFEYANLLAPVHFWIYHGLPFTSVNIAGVSLSLLFSWMWMYIIFLSVYQIVYRKDDVWK